MRFENPLTFVRSIKGAPASILWAFAFTRRVMTALELQEWTGYKGDNITVAVRLLVNLGWLAARGSRGPWCLVEGRQLPLMEMLEKVEQLTGGDSDLIGVGATTTTVDINVLKIVKDSVVVEALNPIKSESGPSVVYLTHGVTFEANLAACRNSGIGEPKASTELIDAHVKGLRTTDRIGLAIRRIEANEMPQAWLDEIKEISRREEASELIDDDEELDMTGVGCVWQDETDELLHPNRVGDKTKKKTPMCMKPCKQGSSRWCEEHYEIGTATYDESKEE